MRVLLVLFFVLTLTSPASAGGCRLTDFEAVSSIITEAANQDFDGMLAVAEVIRNGGKTQTRRPFNTKQPPHIWKQAQDAWDISAETDTVKGATMFENLKDFGTPNWDFSKLKQVAKVGDHTFYKEIR